MNRLQGTAANMAIAGYAAKAGSHILNDLRGALDESAGSIEAMKIQALGLVTRRRPTRARYAKRR